MKKFKTLSKSIITLLLFTSVLCGCSENKEVSENHSVKASIASFSSRININANKNGFTTTWKKDDQIGLFSTDGKNNIPYVIKDGFDTKHGEFSPVSSFFYGECAAYYPYSSSSYTVLNGNIIENLNLSNEQVYYSDKPDYRASIMVSKLSDHDNLFFHNIFSILHIKIKSSNNEKLKEIVVRDLSEQNISGNFDVSLENNDFQTTFKNNNYNSKYIKMYLNGLVLNNDDYKDIFIIVPARNYTSGISVKFTNIYDRSLTKTIKGEQANLKPSICYDLPAIEDLKINEYKFNTGMGDYTKDDTLLWD